MQRLMGQKTAACFQRCVGMDAINAVDSVTFEMDRKLGTEYHKRFRNFMLKMQEEDWTVDGAMTDVKGDRGLNPGKQADADLFCRVVERRKDGIVVRGCKAHQTGAVNSHWILVMPTLTMTKEDADFALSFVAPADAEGIFYIYGRQSCDTRKLEGGQFDMGNKEFGGHEAMLIRRPLRSLGEVFSARVQFTARWSSVSRDSPQLRRLQGGRGRRADRRGGPGGRLQRRQQGLAREGQAHRDDTPQRDALLLRHRLLGRGPQDGLGQLPHRPAAGQRLQAT